MNKQAVISLSKRITGRYFYIALKAAKRLRPKKNKLIFVFGGRTHHWPGIGKELYANEPVFREAINKCDILIQETEGISILPNFIAPEDVSFLQDETNIIFTITSLQIALFHLWKSKNIFPTAVMGMSLGEVAGVYAAGGIQLKEALRITASGALLSKLEKKEFVVLQLYTNHTGATILIKECPVWMTTIYEINEKSVLISCHKDEKDKVVFFLNSRQIDWNMPHKETTWPYHTSYIKKHKEILFTYLKDIEPAPLQCDYYSAALGKMIPKNAIIPNDFWYHIKHLPVLTHSTLLHLKNAGFKLMLSIGPHPFLKRQILKKETSVSPQFIVLNSLQRGEPEMHGLRNIRRQLKRVSWEHSFSTNKNVNPFNYFRNHLDLSNTSVIENPYPYFSYLQKQGSVHFLPVHNAWICLDYDQIDYVLKHPERFSSTIHNTFDSYLLGADPPYHTVVRSLLQPLFSTQSINFLGEFTATKAHQLLDELANRSQFNFVEDFSLPLMRAVIAKFLGLSTTEAETLNNCINGHVYGLAYINNLEYFFRNYLKEKQYTSTENVATLLISFVKEGGLPFKGAVNLMKMLWIAGITTTSMLLSNAVYTAIKYPQIAADLYNNDQQINKFIEECLRLEAPESELRRITTQEVKLGNQILPAGAIIMLGLRAANRDPKYFETPNEIRFDRTTKRHLSFGGGYHHCLGLVMARVEVRHALKAVLEKLPDLKLHPEEEVSYFPSAHFRGLERLIVCPV